MREYVKKTKVFHLGALAASADSVLWAIWKTPAAIKITAARLAANTACNAANTNYNTWNLKNGSVVVASIANGPASGGTSFTAGAFSSMTVVDAAGASELAAGDTLSFVSVKQGNGLALVGAVLQIEYYDYGN